MSSLRKQGPIATGVSVAKIASCVSLYRGHNAVWVPAQGRDDVFTGFKYQTAAAMRPRSRGASCARALRRWPPSETTRGRRENRVRAAPTVPCAKTVDKAHTSIQVSGGTPAFPAQWFTAYSMLAPVTGLSCHRRPREAFASRELDTSVGVSGPHGFAVRFSHARQSQLPRPPHPTARFVTIASRPSHRVRRADL